MNYNIELIELVSKLAPIQQQLGFVKDGDSVILRAKEVATKIAYKLVAPVSYFDYPGQNLRFYEYKRFMSFFNIFNNKIFFSYIIFIINVVFFQKCFIISSKFMYW